MRGAWETYIFCGVLALVSMSGTRLVEPQSKARSAQTIILRVITDRDKPLEKRKASISLEGFKNGEPVGYGQIAETDQNGETRFMLPSPSPEHFFFYVDLGSPYWYCSCNGIPRTEQVAQMGVVQSAASKYSHKSFEPKAGEVLIVVRKFSFIDKLLYPLMKD